jgi:hypothetical protein
MRETVLLFNIKDKKRAQELQMICMSLRIRVRLIKREEYFQTVGVLAGMKEASETDRIYAGEELADEMMVFAGVTGSHLDQILFMMRKKGMKRIDYKAVLTDTIPMIRSATFRIIVIVETFSGIKFARTMTSPEILPTTKEFGIIR